MIANCFVFFILIRLSFADNLVCPEEPKQPQLSTTFVDSFWYEVFSINDYLNNEPCSHFQITCEDSSSCEFIHARWDSYRLVQLYNGTIVQGADKVTLIFTENSTSSTTEEVNLRFEENGMLIWKCNSTSIADSFASVLMRMETQEDMDAVWKQTIYEHRYPDILSNFPAGLWRRNNFTGCKNTAETPNTFPRSFLVTILVAIFNFKTI